jgi:SET and MYND domain-containing protein
MSVCDEFMTNIGAAVYHELSMFNHSCQPNCVLSFVGSTICIKTIRSIEKGEELTISYIDVAEPRETRRKTLRERYFFTCQCPLCQDKVRQ